MFSSLVVVSLVLSLLGPCSIVATVLLLSPKSGQLTPKSNASPRKLLALSGNIHLLCVVNIPTQSLSCTRNDGVWSPMTSGLPSPPIQNFLTPPEFV